jgi:hypothetical protein
MQAFFVGWFFFLSMLICYERKTWLNGATTTVGTCNKYIRVVGYIEAVWKENLVLISVAASSKIG